MPNLLSFFQNLTLSKKAKVISARNLDVRNNRTCNGTTLFDLLLTNTLSEASTKVTIRIGSESAVGTESAFIFISSGNIINAEYRNYMGELALTEIFKAIEQTNRAQYQIEPMSEHAFSSTVIHTRMDALLFNVAVLLDQERAAISQSA